MKGGENNAGGQVVDLQPVGTGLLNLGFAPLFVQSTRWPNGL